METDGKQKPDVEEELAAYEKLRQRISKSFGELNEKMNTESISQAINRAMGELKEKGDHSREVVARAGETLKKDIVSTTEQIKPKLDKVTAPAREEFDHWMGKGGALWDDIANETAYVKELSRDKSGAFFLNITQALSEWSQSVSDKLGTSLQYRTGEITHGGEFLCVNCEGKIHLKRPGRIPPCPKCSKTEFRRS